MLIVVLRYFFIIVFFIIYSCCTVGPRGLKFHWVKTAHDVITAKIKLFTRGRGFKRQASVIGDRKQT